MNRTGIRRELASNQVEQRSLARAVWPVDQAALALFDIEVHVASDAQSAERFSEPVDDQSAHCRGPAVIGKFDLVLALSRQIERVSRATPGTRPSGINTTIATKIAPSMKFQRST